MQRAVTYSTSVLGVLVPVVFLAATPIVRAQVQANPNASAVTEQQLLDQIHRMH
jgi:hypothetical protein